MVPGLHLTDDPKAFQAARVAGGLIHADELDFDARVLFKRLGDAFEALLGGGVDAGVAGREGDDLKRGIVRRHKPDDAAEQREGGGHNLGEQPAEGLAHQPADLQRGVVEPPGNGEIQRDVAAQVFQQGKAEGDGIVRRAGPCVLGAEHGLFQPDVVVERKCPAGRSEGAFKIKAPLHDGMPQIGPRIGGIAGEIHALGGEGQFGRRRSRERIAGAGQGNGRAPKLPGQDDVGQAAG